MMQIPDAPWIRDAELNGKGADDVYCPCCHAENPDTFYIDGGTVIGCSECIRTVDPWEWVAEHGEDERDG